MRDELREKIAKLEHEQWSHWLVYMLNFLLPQNINRWKRQAETPFEKLSEKEKDSDRVWADKVLSLIEGERCVWVKDEVAKPEAYFPSCRDGISFGSKWDFPFCPCCGKRIEVKDALEGKEG